MSGHSKWSTIKHKKAAVDAKRGKLFTKLIKELTIAAKMGGGDPETNPRLRLAIYKAKTGNMPNDNIERAIKKGTGELPGVSYEDVQYEGYGPGGVAIYVQTTTDNKNRTAPEIRSIFSKRNGNMAGAGSVAWLFEAKGLIVVSSDNTTEEKLLEIVLNAGAEDLKREGQNFEVYTQPAEFEAVKKALQEAQVEPESAELTMIPKNVVKVTGADAKGVLDLIEALEDHDDVQHVFANFDIPEEELEKIMENQ